MGGVTVIDHPQIQLNPVLDPDARPIEYPCSSPPSPNCRKFLVERLKALDVVGDRVDGPTTSLLASLIISKLVRGDTGDIVVVDIALGHAKHSQVPPQCVIIPVDGGRDGRALLDVVLHIALVAKRASIPVGLVTGQANLPEDLLRVNVVDADLKVH